MDLTKPYERRARPIRGDHMDTIDNRAKMRTPLANTFITMASLYRRLESSGSVAFCRNLFTLEGQPPAGGAGRWG